MTGSSGVHTESEDHPWTIDVGDHPEREDTPAYRASRAAMIKLVAQTQPWFFGDPPYQDHHGGGVWVKDDTGWLLLLGLAGIEWSAQFCADPAKVDLLRQYAARLCAGFPQTLPGYAALGYADAETLLTTPIVDANGVQAWTDGLFNACVPLPAELHTGVLMAGSGYHHYPKPIIDITTFKQDDFTLFVNDTNGAEVAVAPVSRRGSGDGRVSVLWSAANAPIHAQAEAAADAGKPLVLDADHPLAQAAFKNQTPATQS
ncbi:MAG TPA: DUF6424 family protein [Mycobacteriales bacterium]|nr:DUF6424 family protein [Mycobacteriales bacterium]